MNIQAVYRPLIRGFRRRRMRRFLRTFAPSDATPVLDVGGTPFNWDLIGRPAPVTLLNLSRPAGAEPGGFSQVRASGTALPFRDGSFALGFSNSVIEHVGPSGEREAFASELRRVARGLWVQTPARGFFFEPHLLTPFIHYLPRSWQLRLVRRFTVWGWLTRPDPAAVERAVNGTRLLSHREFAALFPDCEIRRERFLGWTKAYVAVRRRPSQLPAP